MEEPIEVRAFNSLGLGFDLTNDFRLQYAKGFPDGRLVVLDEKNRRDIVIPGGVTIPGVSNDIRCDKGDRIRFMSDVLEFNKMSEFFNQKSSIQGKIPSVLQDKVRKAVPPNWDPASLSRFIETYGTHIIVGMAIGGQDVICVKQKHSSSIPAAELKGYLEDLGDSMFSDRSTSPLQQRTRESKKKVPEVFYHLLQSNPRQISNTVLEASSKDGLTIICSKRGGDVYCHSHYSWLQTVPAKPDAILFKFVPITSLLTGIQGSGYLSHAINLYLRYKPALKDLQYFLEFQVPLQWAPMYNELPLGPQRRKTSCPSLQFHFLGPKLHVNSTQVSSDRKPVTGLRLYLEGKKCNQLALHVQHLSSVPHMLESLWASSTRSWSCQWRGSDDDLCSRQYLEPVKWKRYSNVCTAAVRHDPKWLQREPGGVFVVTGAQLLTKGKWPKTVLHLRLLFTYLPNCSIRKAEWAVAPVGSHKSSFLTNLSTTFTQREAATAPPKQVPAVLNSGVYPDGPPSPNQSPKMLKYVETIEVLRGPHDAPGHWLVTAAKLVTEGGKIGLHVKFGLLNYSTE
uniref:MACPF domain-containing protein n=1 Tax=Nelumbo nucifera TaxID=4432 RepID=A0A822XZJ2_NELNU|nr:TPA_asm: hypothetical protein HUJ06_025688 [Nelumbo nucifera]